jgi:hypothetical protein
LHDFNPSEPHPMGLFWTVPVSASDIAVDLPRGTASLTAHKVPVLDHGQIPNALTGMGPAPEPATVSFQVVWSGGSGGTPVASGDQKFTGQFLRGNGQMEWTATVGDYKFVSAPLASSSSSFAEIGRESNGIFFHGLI